MLQNDTTDRRPPAVDQSEVDAAAAALLAPLDGRSRSRTHPHRVRRLSGRPALYLLASLIVSLLASSSAPTPLYAVYQAR
jgi:hypothetical protein